MYNSYNTGGRRYNTRSSTTVQYLQYRQQETQYRKQDNHRIATIQEAGQLYNTYNTRSRIYNTGSRTSVRHVHYRNQETQYRKQDNRIIATIQEGFNCIQSEKYLFPSGNPKHTRSHTLERCHLIAHTERGPSKS